MTMVNHGHIPIFDHNYHDYGVKFSSLNMHGQPWSDMDTWIDYRQPWDTLVTIFVNHGFLLLNMLSHA